MRLSSLRLQSYDMPAGLGISWRYNAAGKANRFCAPPEIMRRLGRKRLVFTSVAFALAASAALVRAAGPQGIQNGWAVDNARNVWKQESSPRAALIFHNHTENRWI